MCDDPTATDPTEHPIERLRLKTWSGFLNGLAFFFGKKGEDQSSIIADHFPQPSLPNPLE